MLNVANLFPSGEQLSAMTEPIYEAESQVLKFADETSNSVIVYISGLDIYYPAEAPPPGPLMLFWLLATAYLAMFFYLYLHYKRDERNQIIAKGRDKRMLLEECEPLMVSTKNTYLQRSEEVHDMDSLASQFDSRSASSYGTLGVVRLTDRSLSKYSSSSYYSSSD